MTREPHPIMSFSRAVTAGTGTLTIVLRPMAEAFCREPVWSRAEALWHARDKGCLLAAG